MLETIEEGINHNNIQLSELRHEEALTMLTDVAEGVVSIERALEPIVPELVENNIVNLTTALKENIIKTVGNYEKGKETSLGKKVNGSILLDFGNWRKELDRALRPYILS